MTRRPAALALAAAALALAASACADRTIGEPFPTVPDADAGAYDSRGIELLALVTIPELGGQPWTRLNDVWGWTDPETGREYGLVGRTDAAVFVDVTDPAAPRVVGELPLTDGASASTWRDIKVHADHAFIVADGAGEHGMQVFDLRRLRGAAEGGGPVVFDPDVIYDGIASAHNMVIDPDHGLAVAVGASGGGDTCGGGLHMIDVRDPLAPAFVGCFNDPATGRAGSGYTHDAQCVTYRGPDARYLDRRICLGANENRLSIADVTDPAAPVALAAAAYPATGYLHQGWLTDDHRYFYMDDELDEIGGGTTHTRTLIWDVAVLDDPVLAGEYTGTSQATDHNLYVRGDRLYQANYASGLRVLDISDPEDPVEIGFFDTLPGADGPGFDGAWSVYPFFPSGTLLVTGIGEGLFVLRAAAGSGI